MELLLDILLKVLKQDERFVSNEWILLKNTIREKAENLDSNLISLLLDNEVLREKFFLKIKDIIVFDNNKFIKFINNKAFLPDSYTSFKNKIGLTTEKGDFIASSNEVVLSFPFKDCVLAWWQDKEDIKRDEVFYNEILWQDDIDRLLDKKVFTNFKRIDKNWEHKLEWFNRDENGTISDNLIIKWNNLLALHSLKSNFAGKVKLIYIDPPYNTWNDSFNYNDKFNHSTWLTFMKNRLEVAKELLRDDWAIFVQCDDNEQAYLKVLMDEIFWINKFVWMFMWMKTSTPPSLSKNIRKKLEYLLCFKKDEINNLSGWIVSWWDMPLLNNWNKIITLNFPPNTVRFNIKDWIYGIWVKDRTELIEELEVFNWLNKTNLIIKWPFKWTQETLNKELNDWTIFIIKWDKFAIRYERLGDRIKVPSNLISKTECDVWTNEDAKKELIGLFWESVFDYPKPESLIKYIIETLTEKNDIVLDYHLWSGTTCAVAHKIWRQYIWIEQMDYIETISKERMKKVIEWEQWWISKNLEWKWWWDFVYMEIMQENERFIEEIKKAKNIKDLLEIYNQIKDSEFINYKVNTWNLNIDNLNEKDFENFKLFLIEILDKNLLYKNYSERNDENSWVNQDDRKLNNLFYNN